MSERHDRFSRRWLCGAALAVPAALALPRRSAAAARAGAVAAIDIHHHFIPPFYKPLIEPWLRRYGSNADEVLAWTPEVSLASMDKAGVETAVLSLSAPLTHKSAQAELDVLRRANDYAAGLVHSHPGRFRFFGAVPTQYIDEALAEARHVVAQMGAVGIALLSNYDGKYLGDARFIPLFAEVSRLNALVYVHPTIAPCCGGLVPDMVDALVELPVDTGRTIANLLWSGTLSRNPGCRWIFAHGGGITPSVLSRVEAMGFINPALRARVPEGPEAALAKLYVDTASIENPVSMASVQKWLPPTHILFGSDFPWLQPDRLLASLDQLGLPANQLAAIRRTNALALLARTAG